MKKLALTLCTFLLFSAASFAQRYAFVDTDYILENIPAYTEAQKELDDLSERWQKTVEAKYAEIDRMYKAYQAEKILLTEDAQRQREEEIITKEKEAKEYQKSKFGIDGELFQKRQELVKPIQDEIFNAVKEIAERGSYAVIFDKSSQSNLLYTNPKYDKSDEVLRKMKN